AHRRMAVRGQIGAVVTHDHLGLVALAEWPIELAGDPDPGDRAVGDILVTACGRLCLHRKRINISTVLAGQRLGIKEVDDGIWLVSFMHYDLGYFDLEQKTLQPLDNPFGTRLSPMSSARSVPDGCGLDKV